MNEITVFDFEENSVRSVLIDGEPWFVGKDVCRCLEIVDHKQALRRLEEDERGGVLCTTPSGNQTMTCINEPGLYRLVFTSRVEAAQRFKRWLAHEVLPALRKTGRFEISPDPASGPDPIENLEEALDSMSLVRECRLLYGRYAARRMVRALPALAPLAALEMVEENQPSDEPVYRFVRECLEPAPEARLESSLLYTLYLDWCTETGQIPDSKSLFGRKLTNMGMRKKKTSGKIYRLGWIVNV